MMLYWGHILHTHQRPGTLPLPLEVLNIEPRQPLFQGFDLFSNQVLQSMCTLRIGSVDFGPTNRIADCMDIQAVEFGTQLIKGHQAIVRVRDWDNAQFSGAFGK
jgi:hypothetical protein